MPCQWIYRGQPPIRLLWWSPWVQLTTIFRLFLPQRSIPRVALISVVVPSSCPRWGLANKVLKGCRKSHFMIEWQFYFLLTKFEPAAANGSGTIAISVQPGWVIFSWFISSPSPVKSKLERTSQRMFYDFQRNQIFSGVFWYQSVYYQAIPGESILMLFQQIRAFVARNGERTNQLMFYVIRGFMERWWFLDLNQFASNWPRRLDKKFDI